MANLTSADRAGIFNEFGGAATNTGSVEAQVAILTRRIEHISKHLGDNKKDFNSRRGLMQMVGKRKSLLAYLTKSDLESYRNLIDKLGLRK